MTTLNKKDADNTINITGVVGLDTTYEDIARQLDNSKSDIEILINSPGGYVYDGIAIYNSIKKYNKGSKTVRVCGLSASIATYIMLAGDRLELEENSVIMIHNPSICVMGDYRKLRSAYSNIEKLRVLMSSAYSKYTGIAKNEIETMMDNETFFIGKDELETWGNVLEDLNNINNNANEKINNNNKKTNSDKETIKAEANIQIQAMCSLIEKSNEKNNANTEKLVALLENYQEPNQKSQSTEDNINNTSNKKLSIINHQLSTNKKETKMEKIDKKTDKTLDLENLNDLKLYYPKLYDEAVNIGIQQEKSRVKAHLEFIDIAPDIALNAIKEDISFLNNSEIQAKYIKARVNKNELATMEMDNNPDFIPKKINESEELKAELEKENKEAEEKIKAYMLHLKS